MERKEIGSGQEWKRRVLEQERIRREKHWQRGGLREKRIGSIKRKED